MDNLCNDFSNFSHFFDELLSDVDNSEKDIILQNLKSNLLSLGDYQTSTSYYLHLCILNELEMFKKLKRYQSFKKHYNKKVFLAIVFGILFPLFLTIFIYQLKYKLLILIFVILSIISSAFYIIVLEYLDSFYKKELNL